jgi:hypothetical protein
VGLHIQYVYARQESGDDTMREVLAGCPVPSAIHLLLFEIAEVQADRVALLLRHDAQELGEGPFNYMRRYIRAGAAAAVQVLMETGMRE